METIALVILFGLPIAWVFAELCDARKILRITFGLSGFLVWFSCLFMAHELSIGQQNVHSICLEQIRVLLDQGDHETVKRALEAYKNDRNLQHAMAIMHREEAQK